MAFKSQRGGRAGAGLGGQPLVTAFHRWWTAGGLCLIFVASVAAQDRASVVQPGTFSVVKTNAEWIRRANALIADMTIEEKVGQLVLYASPGSPNPESKLPSPLENEIRKAACGAVFNAHTVAYVRKLQTIALQETRMKIPLLFGYDT